MAKKSEYEKVRAYLLSGKKLTHYKCQRMFNVSRLAVVVNRMRNSGVKVVTNMITTPFSKKQIGEYYVES